MWEELKGATVPIILPRIFDDCQLAIIYLFCPKSGRGGGDSLLALSLALVGPLPLLLQLSTTVPN